MTGWLQVTMICIVEDYRCQMRLDPDAIVDNKEMWMLGKTSEFNDWIDDWSTPAPSTYQRSETLAFQRWFKFKEAFSPALVKEAITALPHQPKKILDCFGGSGTTAVVARMLGIPSILIEVNPFLADVIQTKLADYSTFDLPLEAKRVLKSSLKLVVDIDSLRGRLPPTFVEPGKNNRWIFNRDIAIAIEQLRLAIGKVSEPIVRRMFNVALGSVLVESSNVRIDGKARRYRTKWQERTANAEFVRSEFINSVARMVEDIARFPQKQLSTHRTLIGDSRKLIRSIEESSIDFAIFSPPYPNSFDYTDIYNIELWMLGYFETSVDNSALRMQTMRSHVQIKWEAPSEKIESKTLAITFDALKKKSELLWDARLPEMILAYFCDLSSIIFDISKILTKDGHIAINVGNSAYAGITVDSSEILREIAHNHGFIVVECKSVRVMRTSSQQTTTTKALDEWLMLLRRRDS